jgi:hypothetical protein
MNREQYIELRNSGNIDFELFYEYYITHCKEPIIKTIEEFIQAFIQWLNTLINPTFDKVFQYYDNKFNVIKILDVKLNKIIRYK